MAAEWVWDLGGKWSIALRLHTQLPLKRGLSCITWNGHHIWDSTDLLGTYYISQFNDKPQFVPIGFYVHFTRSRWKMSNQPISQRAHLVEPFTEAESVWSLQDNVWVTKVLQAWTGYWRFIQGWKKNMTDREYVRGAGSPCTTIELFPSFRGIFPIVNQKEL